MGKNRYGPFAGKRFFARAGGNGGKNGEADAFFFGKYGGNFSGRAVYRGRIKGIDRRFDQYLPVALPNAPRRPASIWIRGQCRVQERNLVQSEVGPVYASQVLGVANPRVALLNNGAEADKGDSFHKAVHQPLAADIA